LLNFGGTDTVAAAYYAQYYMNGGKPVGTSIPATEHSVMTSYATEQQAVERMIQMFGANPLVNQLGIFATVIDSKDHKNFLNNIVPNVYENFKGKFGLWVLRPDSGDPVAVVMQALRAAEKTFGVTRNKKGFKVLNGAAVIQGDGISIVEILDILSAAVEEEFSVENIAFGMGGGLLQKMNRDTLSFATKLSHITYNTGAKQDIMKRPSDDKGKYSLPGIIKVVCEDAPGVLQVFPIETETTHANALHVIYNKGPVERQWPSFDHLKTKINHLFTVVPAKGDGISAPMKAKIAGMIAKG
jgi:nicotinic acid phosphoribosyltransferase